MSETFTYSFQDPNPGGGTDTIIVTTNSTPANTTGAGLSLTVESITGTVDGVAIDGVAGVLGQEDNNGAFIYDNAIFTDSTGGVFGNIDGLDNDGLLFTAGTDNAEINLFSNNGSLEIGTYGELTSGSPVSVDPTEVDYSPACFCPGTMILTARGEIPVEQLQIGDFLPCLVGQQMRQIKWIGHRATDIARHPNQASVRPIRVLAHAFGPQLPRQDLRLSPQHAIYLKPGSDAGVLVPVRHLINGITIYPEDVPSTVYYHIELASPDGAPIHDVIFANGMPCETYLDTGNRAAFDNGGPSVMLHPNFEGQVPPHQAAAKQVESGPELVAIHARMRDQFTSAGFTTTRDPGLTLIVDGAVVIGHQSQFAYRFVLPKGAKKARLISNQFVPSQVYPNSIDCRALGTAIKHIKLDGTPVELNDPRLSTGWLPPEENWRWTTGDATIDVTGAKGLQITRLAARWAGLYWCKQENLKAQAA